MTSKIRAIAVDDEPFGLMRVRDSLKRHRDFELVAEIDDSEAAVDQVSLLSPDVLFLDIQMPGLDGFELLESLPQDKWPLVVFISAFGDYAVKAFEVRAFDYLTKPFDNERFDEMINNVRRRLQNDQRDFAEEMKALLAEVSPANPYARRIRVTTGQRTQFVKVENIRYISSDGNYVILHTVEGDHRMRVPLTDLHERLDPDIFVRIRRGAVLNLDYVREVQAWFSGDYMAILNDGLRLKITRRHRDNLFRLSF